MTLLVMLKGYATTGTEESHILVSMRMIGHQVLLSSGDSTSRVLPIEKTDDQYKIQFESALAIQPDDLAAMVDSILTEGGIANYYLVEVKTCDSAKIVYSYDVMPSPIIGLQPCRKRELPVNCYTLHLTIIEHGDFFAANTTTQAADSQSVIWIILGILFIVGILIFLRRDKSVETIDPEIMHIGTYQFDKKNMILMHKGQRTELTSKESDLLLLLYTSANKVLERDDILRIIWGDEGNYIGRTLDVFISKLRKKLADDSTLKIINVRGVGYKFIVGTRS